jgi:hypothetical protein
MKGTKDMPWAKQEIIDAVCAEYTPFCVDDMHTWTFFRMAAAFNHVVRSGHEGRVIRTGREEQSPAEQELWLRIARVWTGLQQGRDPHTAYDTPTRREHH